MASDGEYPSVREALSNDSKVVNAYCGLKYTFWNLIYGVLAVLGAIATVVFGIALVIFIALEKIWGGLKIAISPVTSRLGSKAESAAVKAGGAVKGGHEKSKETPVLRRLWGECPVSFKNPPEWFDKLADKFDQMA